MTQRATEFYGEQFAAIEAVQANADLFEATILRAGPLAVHAIKNRGNLLKRDDITRGMGEVALVSHEAAMQEVDIAPQSWRWTGMNRVVEVLPDSLLKPIKTGTIERVVLDYVAPDELPREAQSNVRQFFKPSSANMEVKFPDAAVYGRIDAHLMIGRIHSIASAGIMLFPHIDKRFVNPQLDVGIRTFAWGKAPQPAHELYEKLRLKARQREGHSVTHPVQSHWKIPE